MPVEEQKVKIRVKGIGEMKDVFELQFGFLKRKIAFSKDGIAEVSNYIAQQILKELPGSYEIVHDSPKSDKPEGKPSRTSKSGDSTDETKKFAEQM